MLKVAIEHGPVLPDDWTWELDINTRMPVFLCAGEERARQYREAGGRATDARAIGPLALYAPESGERPPGDRLLFFPPHSSHLFRAGYDFGQVERMLERRRAEWNEVSICVYWRDVLDGHADIYRSLGYECVTAGHIYDPMFLGRLRTIIERCDAVLSIEIGSHIFYSIALGRPVTLERQRVDYGPGTRPGMVGSRGPAWHAAMERLRGSLENGPTEADLDWIRDLVGMREHKSAAEMRTLLDDAEDLYRRTYRLPERIAHVGRARAPQPVRQAASWLAGRTRRG
jgi:hypothetical protein